MIFPEDKLKIASKMLEEAWDRCPLENEAVGQHWMAVAYMLQVVVDYKEEVRSVVDYKEEVRSVIGCEEERARDESEAV